MKLGDDLSRKNVDDRRGRRGPGLRLGLGGALVVLVLSVVTGRNLFQDLGVTNDTSDTNEVDDPERRARETELEKIAVGTFNDAQRVFDGLLGARYREAKLVLFWDEVDSACGGAESAMGPFYCPGDQSVFIDLGFYDELSSRFGAPGDFAQAYVIAHEVGHHVQNVLGIERKVRAEQRAHEESTNALSVRMELQADCFAGVWGHAAAKRELLEKGDIEEAMRAAKAIGDDRLQKAAGRRVNPETFTHGTSAQRARWFHRGLERGTIEACDTFTGEP